MDPTHSPRQPTSALSAATGEVASYGGWSPASGPGRWGADSCGVGHRFPTYARPRAAQSPRGHPQLTIVQNFLRLWLYTFFLFGGFWGQQIVIGWLTYDLTRSPLLTALVLGLDALPFLLVGPAAGEIADRWDRRKVLIAVSAYQAILTAGFAALIGFGWLEPWQIFVFALAMGPSWAVSDIVRIALVPVIVPRQNLVNAYALKELALNVNRLVVPAVLGVTIATLGPANSLLLMVAMYLGALTFSVAIDSGLHPSGNPAGAERVRRFGDGLRYVAGHRFLQGAILLMLLPPLFLLPTLLGLIPVYASEVFHVGPVGLGILLSAAGVGGLLGTIITASLGDIRFLGRALLLTLGLCALGTLVFSLTPWYLPSIPVIIIPSAGMASYYALCAAAIQCEAPDGLRGRLWALGVMSFGLLPIGSLFLGGLSERIGAPSASLIGAVVCLVLMVALSLRWREVWRFGEAGARQAHLPF